MGWIPQTFCAVRSHPQFTSDGPGDPIPPAPWGSATGDGLGFFLGDGMIKTNGFAELASWWNIENWPLFLSRKRELDRFRIFSGDVISWKGSIQQALLLFLGGRWLWDALETKQFSQFEECPLLLRGVLCFGCQSLWVSTQCYCMLHGPFPSLSWLACVLY